MGGPSLVAQYILRFYPSPEFDHVSWTKVPLCKLNQISVVIGLVVFINIGQENDPLRVQSRYRSHIVGEQYNSDLISEQRITAHREASVFNVDLRFSLC